MKREDGQEMRGRIRASRRGSRQSRQRRLRGGCARKGQFQRHLRIEGKRPHVVLTTASIPAPLPVSEPVEALLKSLVQRALQKEDQLRAHEAEGLLLVELADPLIDAAAAPAFEAVCEAADAADFVMLEAEAEAALVAAEACDEPDAPDDAGESDEPDEPAKLRGQTTSGRFASKGRMEWLTKRCSFPARP